MANEIRVEKCFYDLNEYMDYSGFLTQAEVPYLVFGAEEELAALNAVREASPETLENLTRQTLEISERINQDIFKVLVTYEIDVFGGSTGDNEPEPSFAFDTGGGSKHVNQSIATVSKTPSDAPDYGVYLFKKGFQGEIEELVGDFHYVIHPTINRIYDTLRGIKHKLRG